MRVAIRAALAVAIIVAVCVILAVMITGRPKSSRKEIVTEPERSEVAVTGRSGWPVFRGGQRLLGRASGTLPDSMTLVWKFKTNGEIKSSPVIDDHLVFIGSSDANVYAIDLENGQQVWAYKTGDAVEAAPCVVEGSVFVGSSDNFLYALDAKSGALK